MPKSLHDEQPVVCDALNDDKMADITKKLSNTLQPKLKNFT